MEDLWDYLENADTELNNVLHNGNHASFIFSDVYHATEYVRLRREESREGASVKVLHISVWWGKLSGLHVACVFYFLCVTIFSDLERSRS